MPAPLRVLILEDQQSDAELMLHTLRRAGFEPIWQRAETKSGYLEHLAPDLDVVLADYTLPQLNALHALRLLKVRGLDIPFIVITGTISEEVAVECMKEGAADYLLKDRRARLGPAVARALEQRRLRDEKRRSEEERARLVEILEATTDFVGVADAHGRALYLNRGGRKMIGFGGDDDISGFPINEAHPLWAWAIVQNEAIPTAVRKGTWSGEIALLSRDGREIPVSQVMIAHKTPDGGVGLLSMIARDISGRKRAEERIRGQLQRVAALRNIDMAITASVDLRVTLNVLLDQTTSILNVHAASVLLLNPHTQTLEYAAGRGFRSSAIEQSRLRLGEGHAGRAALERRIVGIPDLAATGTQFVRAALLTDEGFVSYYAAPLVAKGQVKGVLETFHRAPHRASQDWLDFLEALAGQAAIAIDNATLFDDLQLSNVELTLAYDTTLEGWSRALDLRDKETEGHTRRVTELTVRLAKAMGVGEDELVHVRRGALLHDIGKMGIPDAILLKPRPLTDEEWEIMKKHPVFAYELLSPIAYLRPALDIPYCHHEKWDGTGYPRGLRGEQIPLAARIFAVMDVWDALRSDRPYRLAWSDEQVREYIREQAGKHFDPRVAEAFLELQS